MKKSYVIALFLVITGMGCHSPNNQKQSNQQNTIRVTTAIAKKLQYHPVKTFNGTSLAYKEANLGTTLPGKVEKIHYEKGSYVQAGALLVELSAELYTQALAKKRTLKKDLQRLTRLKEKGSITQQKYDHVKAEHEAAKAKAQMMKENCRVRAPFSGIVVDHLVQEGENYLFAPGLKPGYSHTSGIVQLMQLNSIKIQFDVHETDLRQITPGLKARVTLDAFPDTTYYGKITHIAPILSTTTHSAKVEVTVKNPRRLIKPGMYAKIAIIMPLQTDVFIPMNATFRQKGTGKHYVFVIKDNHKAIKKPVSRLYTKDRQIAVKGIADGEKIVVYGKNKLQSGDQVTFSHQETKR
jgi:membrane fusion protein, multidrug efflux system